VRCIIKRPERPDLINIFSAVLASFLLNEELGHLGRIGCALCLIGSLIIVLHAPEDKVTETVDEILLLAVQPGVSGPVLLSPNSQASARVPNVLLHRLGIFLGDDLHYCSSVRSLESNSVHLHLLYGRLRVCHGRQGLRRRRETYLRRQQPIHTSEYICLHDHGDGLYSGANELFQQGVGYVLDQCVCLSLSTLNSTTDAEIRFYSVNPMYYVGFSSCTIVASLILFQGFNTTGGTNTVSLLAGFAVTFLGVHLLNISRQPEPPLRENGHSALENGLMNPRLSLQGRISIDGWNGVSDIRGDGSSGHGRRSSLYRAQSTTLLNAFEEDDPNAVALDELHEEDEDEADERTRLHRHDQRPSRSRNESPFALQDSARSSPRPI
jgi:hypothetical protein